MDWRTKLRYAQQCESIRYRIPKTSTRCSLKGYHEEILCTSLVEERKEEASRASLVEERKEEAPHATLVEKRKKETAFPRERIRRLQSRNHQIDIRINSIHLRRIGGRSEQPGQSYTP